MSFPLLDVLDVQSLKRSLKPVAPPALASIQANHPLAIATRLNQATAWGMQATVWRHQGLCILLEGNPTPSQAEAIAWLQSQLLQLKLESAETIKVFGRQTGQSSLAWQQEFPFQPLPTQSSPTQASPPDIIPADPPPADPSRVRTAIVNPVPIHPTPAPATPIDISVTNTAVVNTAVIDTTATSTAVVNTVVINTAVINAPPIDTAFGHNELKKDPETEAGSETESESDAETLHFLRIGLSSHLSSPDRSENGVLLSTSSIQEVLTIDANEILPVPSLADWVLGVYNRRGDLLWLISLDHQLRGSASATNSVGRSLTVVVVESGTNALGLVVPQVREVDAYRPDDLHPPAGDRLPAACLPFVQSIAHPSGCPVLDVRALIAHQVHALRT